MLDVAPEIGMARARDAGRLDKIERESADFFERVRAGYLARAAAWPERIRVVDAAPAPDTVRAALWREVSTLLAARGLAC